MTNATEHRVLYLCIWAVAVVVVIGGYAMVGLILYRLWETL